LHVARMKEARDKHRISEKFSLENGEDDENALT
jgi:hypothetical protein